MSGGGYVLVDEGCEAKFIVSGDAITCAGAVVGV